MTITSHATKLNALQDRIVTKIDSLSSRVEIGAYLDALEAEMFELPYGDMLYEFAWEYAQSALTEIESA